MKTSVIVPRLFGGLGNQLFIYAAARRLSVVHGADLALDDVSGFIDDRRYRRSFQLDKFNIKARRATRAERLEPLPRVRRYLKRSWNGCLPYAARNFITQKSADFDPRLLVFRPSGVVHLEGYWQSELYFKDIEPIIRDDLKIISPADERNQDLGKAINEANAVSVHVRFFDHPAAVKAGVALNNAPMVYYKKALQLMRDLVPDGRYFVFSDEPDAARNIVGVSLPDATYVSHNKGDQFAYADLWLMAQCRHFIGANSTFSWWGAWLSKNPLKKVIMPGFHARSNGADRSTSWGFDGLIPSGWYTVT